MNLPSVHVLPIIKSLHTSGSLLCWWGPSPTQDVWACSSPPLLLLHWSLAPSLNEAPSPRPRGHAVHGPQSPFSQSRGMTSSTAYLGGLKKAETPYLIMKPPSTEVQYLWLVHQRHVYTVCVSCDVPLTCDGVSEVLVTSLPQQPDQSRHAVTVLNGNLVVWIFAIRDVLQCSAGRIVNL